MNQSHIPLGLTDSLQADAARPATKEDSNTFTPLLSCPKGLGFTGLLDKKADFQSQLFSYEK